MDIVTSIPYVLNNNKNYLDSIKNRLSIILSYHAKYLLEVVEYFLKLQ